MHPIWTLLRASALAVALFFLAAWAMAQPHAHLLGDGERIALDGQLDEQAWQRAPVHDRFVQFLPQDRQPPPAGYRTTVQVVAEADTLVIGVRAFDPAPEQIRAPLTRRDQVKRDQDFVAVIVDAVGDRRSAQFVRVNAAGVIADGLYIAAGDGFVEATARGGIGRFGFESEQKLQHNVIHRGGRQVLADSAVRWLGVLHLSARDSLRVVWQGSRLRREADAALGTAALRDDTRTGSLVFQHRVGLGRNISFGATRAIVQPGDERRDEVFFKAALAL